MILLDTQALVWFAQGDERLGTAAREIVATSLAAGKAAVSPISFWEVAMLVSKGYLDLGRPPSAWAQEICGRGKIIIAPLSPEIAIDAGSLPGDIHGDPADRIIVATARGLACPLLTSDRKIRAYADAGHVAATDARR